MKLPKCNGRPQLWSRRDFRGIRILYPDGRVSWSWDEGAWENTGCTSRKTQKGAQKAIFKHEKIHRFDPPEFLGYL